MEKSISEPIAIEDERDLAISLDDISKLAKALSSATRHKILKMLQEAPMDVSRIAERLNQTEANVSAQIKILSQAGLIDFEYQPGHHGVRKICRPKVEKITIHLK
ncbi:MAG: ArsR/SmtB family transcription factor [Promethearchaeota archaeon]